jgi:class 3 adenylate cyclase
MIRGVFKMIAMEKNKNIAIPMADLSGYTALTETHGSQAAADIMDKYMGIAENCLVGDSRVHERTGDEIMIVSSTALRIAWRFILGITKQWVENPLTAGFTVNFK